MYDVIYIDGYGMGSRGWDGDDIKECDGDDVIDMLDSFSDMEFD